MRQTLGYAALFALPIAVAAAGGTALLAGRPWLGVAFGGTLGGLVFLLVVAGGATGSVDASRSER